MGYKVRFEPFGIEIECGEEETLLEAALRQRHNLQHQCRSGVCGLCKALLVEGDVQLGEYSSSALLDFEQRSGYLLLCCTYPLSDLTVEIFNMDEELLRAWSPVNE